MTEIQIINSMNQSIINKITEFKNKEIKSKELNNYMLLNLCHILKTISKIKAKNEEIQKKQKIEVQKSISKIKSYHGDINYDPKELESNPVMKKLNNPTLESYIPISEIAYSTEIQLYNKNSDKFNLNESLLLKKKGKNVIDYEEEEIDFEEPPIIYLKSTNNLNKILQDKNCINIINNKEDELFDLISKDDDDLFGKLYNDNDYKTFLFYELINSFDEENKEEIRNDDIELDFKKVDFCFYLDDIYLNLRLSKRNSNEMYNTLSLTSGSTSFGSNSTSRGESKINMNKELYEYEFSNYMSFESFTKYCEQMNVDYLRYMLVVYSNMVKTSKRSYICQSKMLINLIKLFILKIGISYKKIYEKMISILSSNNDKKCSFEDFVKSFLIVLKLKDESSVLKYKFIMSLFRFKDEDINVKHINIFLQLIKGKIMFNSDLYDELSRNLVKRYDRIYSNELGTYFKVRNVLICLESFFDKKCTH